MPIFPDDEQEYHSRESAGNEKLRGGDGALQTIRIGIYRVGRRTFSRRYQPLRDQPFTCVVSHIDFQHAAFRRQLPAGNVPRRRAFGVDCASTLPLFASGAADYGGSSSAPVVIDNPPALSAPVRRMTTKQPLPQQQRVMIFHPYDLLLLSNRSECDRNGSFFRERFRKTGFFLQ